MAYVVTKEDWDGWWKVGGEFDTHAEALAWMQILVAMCPEDNFRIETYMND